MLHAKFFFQKAKYFKSKINKTNGLTDISIEKLFKC